MSGTGPCYFCGVETANPEQAIYVPATGQSVPGRCCDADMTRLGARLRTALRAQTAKIAQAELTDALAASGMRVERAVTITVEQADEARERVIQAGKYGYASHDFVYALLAELVYIVEGER